MRIRGALMTALLLAATSSARAEPEPAPKKVEPEPTPKKVEPEDSGPVKSRTVVVVEDPDGGPMTKQLTLSATMLYASMANPEDTLGLFVDGGNPQRLALAKMREPASLGSLRSALEASKPAAASFADAAMFTSRALAGTPPRTHDGVIVFVHAPAPGDEAFEPKLSPSALASLEKAKAPVFVLTFGKRVDPKAYEVLAEKTGGEMFPVVSGADLKQAFAAIFAKLHDTETLPVVGDRIVMDGSIDEATLVVAKGNRIRTPGDRVLNAKSKYPGVEWSSFADYDLVRIKKPAKGNWKVEGPDSEQAVGIIGASKMTLHVEVGPRRPMVGDHSVISAWLTEDGRIVDAYARLKHMVMEAEVTDPSGRLHPVRLQRGEGGRFRGEIDNEIRGYHEVKLTAFSPEVRRERRLTYLVNPGCFSGSVVEEPVLTVKVDLASSCPSFAELYAVLAVKVDGEIVERLGFKRSGRQLVANPHPPPLGQKHELVVQIKGRTMDGHEVRSAADGPFSIKAPDPTLMDYISAVGSRLALLNLPVLLGALGLVAVRQTRKGARRSEAKS